MNEYTEYIESAASAFKTLLAEQTRSTKKMEELSRPVEYASLDKLIIGVCDGDGIGPIICREPPGRSNTS